MKLAEIGGDVEIVRDGEFDTLGLLTSPAHRLLVFVESAEWAERAAQATNVSCVLTTRALASQIPASLGVAAVEGPREAFYALHNRLVADAFYSAPFETTIATTARVSARAYVAPSTKERASAGAGSARRRPGPRVRRGRSASSSAPSRASVAHRCCRASSVASGSSSR